MTTVNKDIDTLASEPENVILTSGFEVKIERLKTRQTMRLLKILTRGAGDALTSIDFSDTDSDAFTGQLIGAVLFSIPEAENETIQFIQSMTSPADLIENPKSKGDKQANDDLWLKLVEELDNPELEDLVDIVEGIIKREAPHIVALGKRLAVLLKAQQTSDTAKQNASLKSESKASTPTDS